MNVSVHVAHRVVEDPALAVGRESTRPGTPCRAACSRSTGLSARSSAPSRRASTVSSTRTLVPPQPPVALVLETVVLLAKRQVFVVERPHDRAVRVVDLQHAVLDPVRRALRADHLRELVPVARRPRRAVDAADVRRLRSRNRTRPARASPGSARNSPTMLFRKTRVVLLDLRILQIVEVVVEYRPPRAGVLAHLARIITLVCGMVLCDIPSRLSMTSSFRALLRRRVRLASESPRRSSRARRRRRLRSVSGAGVSPLRRHHDVPPDWPRARETH